MKTKVILIGAFLLSVISINAQQQFAGKFYETDVTKLLYCGDTVCISHVDTTRGFSEFYFNTKSLLGGLNATDFTLEILTTSAPDGIDTAKATSFCWGTCMNRGVNKKSLSIYPNDTVEGVNSLEYYPYIGDQYTPGTTPFENGYATVLMKLYPTAQPQKATTLTVIFAIGVPELTITPKTADLCTLPSKINEYTDAVQSKYYPNPTQNNINIIYEKPVKGQVIIVNNAGQNVLKTTINNENNISIDVASLPAGSYTCTTMTDAKVVNTFKFIKK